LLTKSDLHSVAQCPRKLWLEKHRADLVLDDDAGADRRKREGIAVGDLARKALGPNVLWPQSEASKEDSAKLAKDLLLANPLTPAVEFPMFFNDFYSRADALIPEGGGYVLRETKASSFPLKKDKFTPDKPDAEHVFDLAIQAYTMEQSGLPMARAELNLINNQWRYPGNKNYEGLFRILDVTEQVRATVDEVPVMIASALDMLAGPMPIEVTGKQCTKPHGCNFLGFCEKLDPPKPAHPIELLPDSAGKKLAKKLKDSMGYVSLLEPAPVELSGANAALYLRMQEAHRTGLPYLSKDSGQGIVNLPYPRYYFDFEGIDLAIPEWEGVRPYEQIPFQWSCHIERSPGVFELGEFLDLSGGDPSMGCIEKMLEVISLDDDGPLYVYFATYERGRLEELALRHPQYADAMETYISRLVDLHPMVKNHFYHPAMVGSFSIKKVLPVIAPDLDYSELSEVQEGIGAQLAYIKAALLKCQTPEEFAETLKNSTLYCRQDTWAMVELAYFLAQLPRPTRPEGL
jgi:CRISPR/Cas system-associated exonuclease Cas4 (RecB family)